MDLSHDRPAGLAIRSSAGIEQGLDAKLMTRQEFADFIARDAARRKDLVHKRTWSCNSQGDFMIRASRRLTAIEVKSGRSRNAGDAIIRQTATGTVLSS
jgi:Ribonuclease G/E